MASGCGLPPESPQDTRGIKTESNARVGRFRHILRPEKNHCGKHCDHQPREQDQQNVRRYDTSGSSGVLFSEETPLYMVVSSAITGVSSEETGVFSEETWVSSEEMSEYSLIRLALLAC